MIYCICVFMCLFITCVISDESDSSTKPEYMVIFEKHQRWEGNYVYNQTTHFCMLFIMSEHYLKKDGLLATLKDTDGATVELEGTQIGENQLEVKFTVHAMFNDVHRFPMNFTFHSTLYQESDKWSMRVDITIPKDGLFTSMTLKQGDDNIGPWFDDGPETWRYVVIIGIPILLAIIGVAGTVAIIFWAVRKGYIRHVPKSYDNFDNPVQYSTSTRDVQI
ncbi:hypothetical protein ACF0H5_020237 [Mactra antiquata]